MPSLPPRIRVRHAALALAAVLVLACGTAQPSLSPGSFALATGRLASATPVVSSSPSPAVSPSASPTPTATPALVPLVPVVSFWSTERSIGLADLGRILAGESAAGGAARKVAVSSADLAPLAAALGVTAAPSVQALAPADVRAFVRREPGAIGVVRAEDATMDVRALAVEGFALFGIERIRDVARWPLLVPEAGPASSFDPGSVWTIAAGGDVMLEKDAYKRAILDKKGVDYPWDGGTAAIDGRVCCGWGDGGRAPLVSGHRTGNAGAVRSLLKDADVALVNLEAPAADNFTYHSTGFTFSVDPEMLTGLKNAGIDAVSLANNHMGNAGEQGVLDTIRDLDSLGIAHAGAGTGQPEARKPAWLAAAGLKIAFLAYSDIQPESYWAAPGHPGTAAYSMAAITADIAAARAAGADYVIVMPHWGIEYSDAVYDFERPNAGAMIAAGADIVLASHSHWVGSIEAIDSAHVAFYSLGNFAFDWTHDERTQEGVLADLTFVGTRLVQIDLHPTVILDGAQPNLLDPATDGQAVLGPVRASSEALLGW